MKPKNKHLSSGQRHRTEKAAPHLEGRPSNHDEIARLAHALYEQEGKPEGKAWDHWFNAESMIENNFGYGKDHTEHDFAKDNLVGRMKIIVQRGDTHEFYKGDGQWTRHKEEAHNFASRQSAHEFCEQVNLCSCKIIVHLREGVADIEMSCVGG